jgi:anti-sigma factor ChrR (cupin superfamily)
MPAYSDQNTAVPLPEDFQVNADFEKRVVIKPEDYLWTPSPMPGVEQQVILDRRGGEMGRATTVSRYTMNSEFPPHVHDGGKEVFVLDGTFADERGEYPPGTYVRNPVGTPSTPRVGANGTTLFVKSHQFSKNDRQQLVIDTNKTEWHPGLVDGLQVMPLHEYEGEHVALVLWAPNTQFKPHSHWGGEEILVLDGVFYDEYDRYPKGSWIRSPHLSQHTPFTKEEGALIYVKVGHLSQPNF